MKQFPFIPANPANKTFGNFQSPSVLNGISKNLNLNAHLKYQKNTLRFQLAKGGSFQKRQMSRCISIKD